MEGGVRVRKEQGMMTRTSRGPKYSVRVRVKGLGIVVSSLAPLHFDGEWKLLIVFRLGFGPSRWGPVVWEYDITD